MRHRRTARILPLLRTIGMLACVVGLLGGRAMGGLFDLERLPGVDQPNAAGLGQLPSSLAEPLAAPARGVSDVSFSAPGGGLAEGASRAVDPAYEASAVVPHSIQVHRNQPWCWQVLPDGLIYRSYLAGAKEPRFAAQWEHDAREGWIWDIALGGRAGLLRYGTTDPRNPEGWQLDIEGAALPRLDLESDSNDLMAADFRMGVPLTYGRGAHQAKFGYYHLSSHLGDELMLDKPDVPRINYVRDAVLWGHSYFWNEDVRLYGEAAYAFNVDGGAEPWEFQFGFEYSPARPTGLRPVPFFAVNGHLREEIEFGGNLTIQVGYQWRGTTGHRFRVGMHYLTGKSDQYEFFNQYEDKVGLGVWYDY